MKDIITAKAFILAESYPLSTLDIATFCIYLRVKIRKRHPIKVPIVIINPKLLLLIFSLFL